MTAVLWSCSPSSSASHSPTWRRSRSAHSEPCAQSGQSSMVIVSSNVMFWPLAQHLRCVVVSSHGTDIQWLKSPKAGSRSYISGENISIYIWMGQEKKANSFSFFWENNWVASYLPLKTHFHIFPFDNSFPGRVAFRESNQNNEWEYHQSSGVSCILRIRARIFTLNFMGRIRWWRWFYEWLWRSRIVGNDL